MIKTLIDKWKISNLFHISTIIEKLIEGKSNGSGVEN
jgi:hypothetical protein